MTVAPSTAKRLIACSLTHGVPPMTDRRWPASAEPLLAEMRRRGRMSIGEILTWGSAEHIGGNLLRNQLAYLSMQGLVHYNESWCVWQATPTA